ncbi:MAG TPA: hypothetical protein VFR86_00015 [Burkholderiaceae bacterium]|nr:hypothetical protein [Burkholderiaceae bacterium]
MAQTSERALALLPAWNLAALYGAEALRRLDQHEAALALLDGRGEHGDEAEVAAWIGLRELERARCLLVLGRTVEAFELLAALPFDDANVAHALAEAARVFEEGGDPIRAERYYDRAIAVARPYGFHRHRAAFFIRRARLDEADADCRQAEELEQRQAPGFSADASYYAVQRWHPDRERQRGLLALARGRFEEARLCFERSGRRERTGCPATTLRCRRECHVCAPRASSPGTVRR